MGLGEPSTARPALDLSQLVVFSRRLAGDDAASDHAPAAQSTVRAALASQLQQAVTLVTCQRQEAWLAVDDVAHARQVLANAWPALADSPLLRGEAALLHLIRTAAGLDSEAKGEPEVMGQARSAYARACEAGTVGPLLHRVAQLTLGAARQVRAAHGLASCVAPLGERVLGAVASALGTQPPVADAPGSWVALGRMRWLVVGFGEAGQSVLRALAGRDDPVTVVNRSVSRAPRLAPPHPTPLPWEALPAALGAADVLVWSACAALCPPPSAGPSPGVVVTLGSLNATRDQWEHARAAVLTRRDVDGAWRPTAKQAERLDHAERHARQLAQRVAEEVKEIARRSAQRSSA